MEQYYPAVKTVIEKLQEIRKQSILKVCKMNSIQLDELEEEINNLDEQRKALVIAHKERN